MNKSKVADFHKTGRQNMLKKTPDEIISLERGDESLGTSLFSVFEIDPSAFNLDDSGIGYGDLENISG